MQPDTNPYTPTPRLNTGETMLPHRTRVIFDGVFWRIQRMTCGEWQTMRDLYSTREQARSMRYWWAQ